jgi:hypothetical protein
MKKIIAHLIIIKWFFMMEETGLPRIKRKAKLIKWYLEKTHKNVAFYERVKDLEEYSQYIFEFVKYIYKGRDRTGKLIILMAGPTTNIIIGTLDLGTTPSEIAARVLEINDGTATSTWITTLPATIAANIELRTNYMNATGATKKTALRLMKNAMNSLLRTYQTASDNDVENGIEILESGGFHIKGVGHKQKQIFKITNPNTGKVKVYCPVSIGDTAYDWWYSADGVTWDRIDPTPHAYMILYVPVGKIAFFKYQWCTKDGPQGISDPIQKLIV